MLEIRVRGLLQLAFSHKVDNGVMLKFLHILGLTLLLTLPGLPLAMGQETEPAGDEDGSSEQVEQQDDSYRRQMELEDARSRDRTYVDTAYDTKVDQEKIDKLPEESRDNIRDQLIDVIVENGDWEPSDILEDYPYEPSAAAQSDPDLEEREQEAWDEQIEKYHEREAAAFGSHRGPVPGPGNPTGQEGGQAGDGSQQGQQGNGQGGENGGGAGGSGTAGTYQPGQSASGESSDENSTAGVSESALDFLRGGRGRQEAPQQGSPGSEQQQAQAQEQAQAQAEAQAEAQEQAQAEAREQAQQEQLEMAAQESEEQQSEQAQETSDEVRMDTPGIIAIKDLDKLEGTGVLLIPEEEEDEEPR